MGLRKYVFLVVTAILFESNYFMEVKNRQSVFDLNGKKYLASFCRKTLIFS